MTINIGIPQIIWLVMAVFGLIYETINHGKPVSRIMPTPSRLVRLFLSCCSTGAASSAKCRFI